MHGEPVLLWMLMLPLAGSAVAMFMPVHARNAVAWLGASAAIFHTMNHATFKASPFKATGVNDHETGTRDLRRLSGPMRDMPIAARR